MWSLAGRRWYVGAIVLGLGAITCQCVAHQHMGRGIMAIARAAGLPPDSLETRQVGLSHIRQSRQWGSIGLAFAILAASSWLFSRRRREHGNQGLLVGLVILYVFLLLLLV
jgi:hypothetical protein